MFLIRMKTMGNCIIPDLDNFMIYAGNNAIIDLEEYFTPQQIQSSMHYDVDVHQCGHLKQMVDVGIIELVPPGNMEWKQQVRFRKQDAIVKNQKLAPTTNRIPISSIIQQLKELDPSACIDLIESDFFDNISILSKLKDDHSFDIKVQSLAKKYYDENLNHKIDKSFILI